MRKRPVILLALVALVATSAGFWGCSSDDPVTPPVDPNDYIKISLRAGARFNYDRWDLDSSNNKVETTKHSYSVDIRGNNGLVLGIYNDWFYRIGTDAVTAKKDTLFIRTENSTKDGTIYTQKLQVYGFTTKVINTIVDAIMKSFPVPTPVIPSATWENMAVFTDGTGAPSAVGTEWTIGTAEGSDITFLIMGFPVIVNVKCKGRLEAKKEMITVNSKQISTWKTSSTVTMSLMSSIYTIKMYTWFSGDPSGQIWVLQESAKISLLNNTLPFNGEKQELVSYY